MKSRDLEFANSELQKIDFTIKSRPFIRLFFGILSFLSSLILVSVGITQSLFLLSFGIPYCFLSLSYSRSLPIWQLNKFSTDH